MSLEIKRKERESIQSLIFRFKKGIQESGILLRAKKIRFKGRCKSELAQKKAALRKLELKKEYEKLKKLGKYGIKG